MRVFMIGQKGLPATFGGIEHHVEELGSRLAERGHDVTVYCRTNYTAQREVHHRGMALRHVPTVGTKHLDAIVHSFLSTGDAMRQRPDIVHLHGLGPGLVAPLPRLLGGSKVVLTVHARDDLRAKWGWTARAILGTAAWMSGRVPDATIAVSQALAAAYNDRPNHQTVCIPNGVNESARLPPGPTLRRLGLEQGRYLLWVGRLVPEKAPDMLVRAFGRIHAPDLRLAVVGGSSFTDAFTAEVRALTSADPRVLMVGYVYGDALAELYSNALAFVLPSNLEGLPLTLLEAASYGLPVVASDIPPHLEVLGSRSAPGRRIFRHRDEDDLVVALQTVVDRPAAERDAADALRQDVIRRYSWDEAADATERLYVQLLSSVRSGSSRPARPRAET